MQSTPYGPKLGGWGGGCSLSTKHSPFKPTVFVTFSVFASLFKNRSAAQSDPPNAVLHIGSLELYLCVHF